MALSLDAVSIRGGALFVIPAGEPWHRDDNQRTVPVVLLQMCFPAGALPVEIDDRGSRWSMALTADDAETLAYRLLEQATTARLRPPE